MWNLMSLFRQIYDERTAIEFLQNRGIIPRNLRCTSGHEMKLTYTGRTRWRCFVKTCRQEKSVRSGNWLEGSKLPVTTIVHFIYCWANGHTSISFCDKELNMSQPTVDDYNNYLREVCVWKLEQSNKRIGGPNLHVEVDESLFTRRKYGVGRCLPQQWVFGGICRETNECFIVPVIDRSANTLIPIIKEKILPGSIILSDLWKAYKEGYTHYTVNHSYNQARGSRHLL